MTFKPFSSYFLWTAFLAVESLWKDAASLPTRKARWQPFLALKNINFPKVYIIIVTPKSTGQSIFYLPMAKVRTQRHVVREKARKRTKSLFKKANELAQIADARVYIVVDRSGKYQIYRSTDQPGWPPSEQEMEKQYPVPRYRGPADFETAACRTGDQSLAKGTHGVDLGNPECKYVERLGYQRRIFTVPKPPILAQSPPRSLSPSRSLVCQDLPV